MQAYANPYSGLTPPGQQGTIGTCFQRLFLMIISMIAAMDRSRAIGRGNDLPWRLPDDLKRFKALTLGKPVLMGRKTAQCLPKLLPGRLNIVLTRSGSVPHEGMKAVASLEEALAVAGDVPELCVIGGGEIYGLLMPVATHLYITHVDTETEGADAFFPEIDPAVWNPTQRVTHKKDERHALNFCFIDYSRRQESAD